MTSRLAPLERLKLDILEKGVAVSEEAAEALTGGGSHPLVEHDYVTTGGLMLVLGDDIYVNAPVDYSFVHEPFAEIGLDTAGYTMQTNGAKLPVRVLPLPDYLEPRDAAPAGIMTHADRIRISPIDGCSCNCRFCDWPLVPYGTLDLDSLVKGLHVAEADGALSAKHVLISGGTPRPEDRPFMDSVYERAIRESSLPVDVMLMPRDGHGLVDRLVDAGVAGFAINLEIFDRAIAARTCPNKERVGLDAYADFIAHAVTRTGGPGTGRVRSLLLVGLEPPESTLEGVRFLAELGCDPVLSPFRPADGTELENEPPPTADLMEDVYLEARAIAESAGVKIGPRCIPCQHNTVAFPDGTDAFYYS
jgi:hypothetical protein